MPLESLGFFVAEQVGQGVMHFVMATLLRRTYVHLSVRVTEVGGAVTPTDQVIGSTGHVGDVPLYLLVGIRLGQPIDLDDLKLHLWDNDIEPNNIAGAQQFSEMKLPMRISRSRVYIVSFNVPSALALAGTQAVVRAYFDKTKREKSRQFSIPFIVAPPTSHAL